MIDGPFAAEWPGGFGLPMTRIGYRLVVTVCTNGADRSGIRLSTASALTARWVFLLC